MRWHEGQIEIVTKDERRVQVKALVSEDGRWAYHRVRGVHTLTHVPSGFAVWRQREPFAFRPLVRDLAAVERADWSFTEPAAIAQSPFAYNINACLRGWVLDGKLRGKVVRRG